MALQREPGDDNYKVTRWLAEKVWWQEGRGGITQSRFTKGKAVLRGSAPRSD